MGRLRGAVSDDDAGSVLLLTIGYAMLAVALVLVCVDATSLYLAQKRLDAVADAAALAGADGFTFDVVDGRPVATLTDEAVTEQAEAIVRAVGSVSIVDASTPDGVSARVTVTARWRPPVTSLFVPEGVVIESTATSRTGFD